MKRDDVTGEAIQRSLKQAESGIYSDLTVRCKEKEYLVHKVLICTRSSFFANEGQSDIVSLPEDDTEAVDSMFCYIYNGFYPRLGSEAIRLETPAISTATWNTNQFETGLQTKYLPLHARVYALAEKYGIADLKEVAARNFEHLSDREACRSEEFTEASKIAYTTTTEADKGLREVVVKSLYGHYSALREPHVQLLLRDCPQLAYDLVMHHPDPEKQTKDERVSNLTTKTTKRNKSWGCFIILLMMIFCILIITRLKRLAD